MKTIIIDGVEYNLTPKAFFKKGDWVVYCNEDVDLITGIEETGYLINKGGYIPFTCQGDMRLWTIQDAKDGDVLYSADDIIVVKEIYNANNPHFISHCSYSIEYDIFQSYERDCWFAEAFVPATKEQCCLLFSKMKEVGYEWDSEKKELKKINLNKAEHGKYYFCIKDYFSGGKKIASKGDVVQALRGLPIMGLEDISEYFIPVKNVHNHALSEDAEKKELRKVEQKPAWSEEDEFLLNDIEESLLAYKIIIMDNDTELANYIEKEINFLKSIKDRVQPIVEWKHENTGDLTDFENAMMHIGESFFGKNAGLNPNDTSTIKEQANILSELVQRKEWSEEDENMLNSIIATCELAEQDRNSSPARHLFEMQTNWLESLKERMKGE